MQGRAETIIMPLMKRSLGVALVLMTLVVYSRCWSLGFVHFDDPDYVTENPQVAAGLTSDSVRWAFATFQCGLWHPLTWLSLQLDRTIYGGLKPGGFHFTNVLLHS